MNFEQAIQYLKKEEINEITEILSIIENKDKFANTNIPEENEIKNILIRKVKVIKVTRNTPERPKNPFHKNFRKE